MTMYVDGAERLSPDDMATRREEEFRALALQRQKSLAKRQIGQPGRCLNCADRCPPLARFCDPGCRSEYEDRVKRLARQGRAHA